MQRTMLAAVQATDEWLIAPWYLMRISDHLAPPYCVIAGLIKHLSPYTGRISEWISFAVSPFAHKKMNNSTLFITGRLQQQRRYI